MATYRDLITRSLRLMGGVAATQTPSDTQATQGLEVLKEIIDAWNGSSLMLFSNAYTTFNFVQGQSTYDLGPSGDWVITPRPVRIDGAWVRDNSRSPAIDIAMTELSAAEFGSIATKDTTSPNSFYFNYDPDWPDGQIKVWPVPADSSHQMVILTQSSLDQTITLNTTETLPPAYRQALVYNLAVALSPEYGIEAPMSVINIALTAKQTIMNNNFESEEMEFDSMASGKTYIYTGYPVRG